MYLLVSTLLVLSILNFILFTPKANNAINKGMKSEDEDEKVTAVLIGCLTMLYAFPYFIIYLITVINLVKVDPYLYPSICILILIIFNLVKTALRNKDKELKDKRTVYNFISKALHITYLIYILIIL